LADEPTGSLDEETERQMLALIAQLQRENGFAVLWMTHRPAPAVQYATSFWQMRDGGVWPSEAPSDDAVAPPLRDSDTGTPLVKARIESHSYRKGLPVLRDIDLVLHAGVTTAVRGPSGVGKSTLARLVAGIERPDAGSVERNTAVSMVWPDPNTALNPEWRVDDAIAEPLQVRGMAKTARRLEARSWMERVRVPIEAAPRRVTELSGGQRRRVLIARAMIGGAQAIVFDEATNGLDAALRDEIIGLLCDLQGERKLAYLWITHDESTLAGFAHQSMRLEGGSLHHA
jgi:peptide/nickel transport system ATP-binding protein